MRFIKGKSGFTLMEKKQRLKSENEYELKKKELFGSIRSRSWWVPESNSFEKVLVLMFGRSNKWLSQPVKRFSWGKKRIDKYQFNCTYLVVEHTKGVNCVEMRFHNIDNKFLFAIIVELMSLNKSLRRLIDLYIVKSEALYVLSKLWSFFIVQSRKSGFGRWVMNQPEMKRLIEYRRNHVTRDNLYV